MIACIPEKLTSLAKSDIVHIIECLKTMIACIPEKLTSLAKSDIVHIIECFYVIFLAKEDNYVIL